MYFPVDSLAAKATPHLDKPVKIVARVKPAKTGKAMLIVRLGSIKASGK